MPLQTKYIKTLTSISSLCFNKGASMMFLRENVSDSISKVWPVRAAILSQCRAFIALLAINSNKGQLSLKSSIVFLRSKNACQSFKARGSFRHLRMMTEKQSLALLEAKCITSHDDNDANDREMKISIY